RIPGAKSVMYPGLGHIPMEEAPERVMTDLRAFLDTSAGTASVTGSTRRAPV
ncbi:MAG: alpha/beta hydrolase, partial [Paraburkholderia fungorum]|nr:alpha/beta hydrolase [Paraburkholderia fungorum]